MATNPTAPVVAHYKPALAKGLGESDKIAISVALRNLTVAAWLASVTKASSKAPNIADGVSTNGLDLGAPAGAGPAWAATTDIPSDDLPDDLAMRLSDLDEYAQTLADGESDLDPEDQADLIARSSTLLIAGLASQAAFRAGGVGQWNLELDGPDPCPACEQAEADGPYDVGSGPDLPIHDRCECEASPITDSSDDSASRSWNGYHNRRTSMSETHEDATTEADEERAKCSTCDGKGTIKDGHVTCPDCTDGEAKSEETETEPRSRRPRARRELGLQSEMRRFQPNEIRAGKQTDDGLVPLEGVVIRYGVPYEVSDMAGTFTETIHRGAAAGVLAGNPDIRMLFNHDGMPLARTGADASLDAWETDEGLCIRALVDPRQTIANDLIVALERGTVTQMSVGMQVDRDADQWSGQDEMGLPNVRNIFGLSNIFDASAVTYPASTTTTLALASRMSDMPPEITVRTQKLWDLAREGRKGTISQADSDTLMHVIESLHTLRTVDPDVEEFTRKMEEVSQPATLTPGVGDVIARMEQDGEVFEIISTEDGFGVRAGASREAFNQALNNLQDLMAEARNEPTIQDAAVLSAIAKAHQATAGALAEQAADPDNNTDPVDKKVMSALQDAHTNLAKALGHQSMDGAPDADAGDDGTQGGDNGMSDGDNEDGSGSRSAKLIGIDMEMAQRRRPILL